MPSLAELVEAFKNAKGRAAWSIGRDLDVMSGYDPALEEFVSGSSLGTGGHGLAAGLAGMIKASHGSPHMFDKFDFSKIGTGEGAQAFGHGGYFAQGFDSPVAKDYQKKLAKENSSHSLDQLLDFVRIGERPISKFNVDADRAFVEAAKESPEAFRDVAEGHLARWRELADDASYPFQSYAQDKLTGYGDLLDAINKSPVEYTGNGHLYNVELKWPDAAREAADPLGMEHFLDWYQPFGEQPKNVKDAVIKALHSDAYKASQAEPIAFNPSAEQSWMADLFTGEKPNFVPSDYYDLYRNRTGEQIYKALVERLGGEKQASAKLRETGLPGMRYQDEKSRSMPFGSGTHNFVMFDDRFPEIVSRNGVSLSDLLRR